MAKKDTYIDNQLESLGKRLRELRKAKGYTNSELFAYQHEIGRAQYGRYEKGANMRVSTLFHILRALEIDPVEFFSEGFENKSSKKKK